MASSTGLGLCFELLSHAIHLPMVEVLLEMDSVVIWYLVRYEVAEVTFILVADHQSFTVAPSKHLPHVQGSLPPR